MKGYSRGPPMRDRITLPDYYITTKPSEGDGILKQEQQKQTQENIKRAMLAQMSNTKLKSLLKLATGEIDAGNDSKMLKHDLTAILEMLAMRKQISGLAYRKTIDSYVKRKDGPFDAYDKTKYNR